MADGADAGTEDPDEIIGRRIIVAGDVNGGYLRTCISNEAGKFRRLLGTMSPPDDGDEAEIYVEVRTSQRCVPVKYMVASYLLRFCVNRGHWIFCLA